MVAGGTPALDELRVLGISASDGFAASLLAMLLADQGAASLGRRSVNRA
jgi:hypothetical protein